MAWPEQDYVNYEHHVYVVDPNGIDRLLERLRQFHPEYDPAVMEWPKKKADQ